jgi:hypothetical protein
MASLKVSVQVELDGVPATWLGPNGRLVRRYEVDESQAFSYEKVDDNGTHATVPCAEIVSVQHLLVVPAAAMTFRLDGQSDAGITVGANGLLLVLGATIDAGASTNVTVSNDSGATAILKGIVAGT